MTRSRAAVLAIWLALASGPVLSGVALWRTSVGAAPDPRPQAPAHVLGYAELVVSAHLTGHAVDGTRIAPQQPEADDDTPASWDTPVLVAATGSTGAGPGRWGVTVATLAADGAVETWQVTVADAGDGPSADMAPALVAQASPPEAPPVRAGRPLAAEDLRAVAVQGFARAWYVEQQDVDRWVSPGAHLLRDASFPTRVDAAEVHAVSATPLEAGRQVVLAEIHLRRSGRATATHLPLLLVSAGDRWEVARVLPALPAMTSATATTPRAAPPGAGP